MDHDNAMKPAPLAGCFQVSLLWGKNMELINVQTCICTFTSTHDFRGNIVKTAVVPSVLNAGDFQRQYDWDVEFVHDGVDRGWQYWIKKFLRIR